MDQAVKQFNYLIKHFDLHLAHKIALAVSGGPDSMLMLYLISQIIDKSKLYVITVNHGLRVEAYQEVDLVKNFCDKNNIKFHQATVENPKLIKNQQDARKFRFEIINKFCLDNNIDTLCIAHNLDDVIENFFIRINRGSGIDGLNVLQLSSYQKHLKIIRPILFLYKEQIIKLANNLEVKYLIDRSNYSLKPKRNAFRHLIEENSNLFDKKHIITTILNISRVYILKHKIYCDAINTCIKVLPFGVIELDLILYNDIDQEIQLEILSNAILLIGENDTVTRFNSILSLYNKLQNGKNFVLTLGGCKIQRKNNILLFCKEGLSNINYQLLPGANVNILGFSLKLSYKSSLQYNLQIMTNKIWKEHFAKHYNITQLHNYIKYLPILMPNDLKSAPQIPTLISDKNLEFYWDPKHQLTYPTEFYEKNYNIIYELVKSDNLG